MKRTKGTGGLSGKMNRAQAKRKAAVREEKEYEGNDTVISTGSTLLDLAISGGRFRGGGIPSGILVEIFGPSQTGKTVLLCELGGAVQRLGGQKKFYDPESRLNRQFAAMFDMSLKEEEYSTPDTVPQLFRGARDWEVKPPGPHIILADSLAALSTNLEMDSEEGDKMGMRRAKEFSQELRRTCRLFTSRNIIMVASNQVRQNADAGPYGQKYISPGGEAIGFYASLRLRTMRSEKIKDKTKIQGKEVKRVIGVTTTVEVHKSSVWKPHRTAPLTIIFDYGIDDIRQNLQFIKDYTKNTTYTVGGERVGQSMREAIDTVEDRELEDDLREEVIDLWEDIEAAFTHKRVPKRR